MAIGKMLRLGVPRGNPAVRNPGERKEVARVEREDQNSASGVQVNITPSNVRTALKVRARALVRDTSSMELKIPGRLHTKLGSSKLIGQTLALGVWYHNNARCSLSLQVSCCEHLGALPSGMRPGVPSNSPWR